MFPHNSKTSGQIADIQTFMDQANRGKLLELKILFLGGLFFDFFLG
jgi:hypothetical protein